MEENKTKKETLLLGWLDPRDGAVMPAGVAFYNMNAGEYFLRIDEEPVEKNYYLKSVGAIDNSTEFRMELAVFAKDGRYLRRQKVGTGYANESTLGNIHINFGSKFKTLVLAIRGNE